MLITVMRVLVFLRGCDEAGIGKFLIYQKKIGEKTVKEKKVTDRTEEEQKN